MEELLSVTSRCGMTAGADLSGKLELFLERKKERTLSVISLKVFVVVVLPP
jgi:hypothetical protein